MRKPMLDEKSAYETMIKMKEGFGTFHKMCFHVHTPASYDYKLLDGWSDAKYKLAFEQDMYSICIERNVFPEMFKRDSIEKTGYPSETKIKESIINYLEDGKESFLHKISIYEYVLGIQVGSSENN